MGILAYEYNISNGDVGEKNKLTNQGFLRLMQEAAITASQSVGYGPNTALQTRIFWVILNWKLKVFSRPKWNDKVTVKTWPRHMVKCYSCRDFEMFDATGKLIAIASSKWVLVSVDTGIMRIPKEMEEEYDCVDKSLFNEPLDKIKEPETSNLVFEYDIQRRDIDTNHHVNNTIYLDVAYEAIPQNIYEKEEFNNVEIMYKHEAKLGDGVNCFYIELENNEHIITIKNKEDDKLHVIVKLY